MYSVLQDYVNASFLESKMGEDPAWAYIATQGPLPHTVVDFWAMVWQQSSNVVVMLTRLVEQGALKCAAYMPEKAGESDRCAWGGSVWGGGGAQ